MNKRRIHSSHGRQYHRDIGWQPRDKVTDFEAISARGGAHDKRMSSASGASSLSLSPSLALSLASDTYQDAYITKYTTYTKNPPKAGCVGCAIQSKRTRQSSRKQAPEKKREKEGKWDCCCCANVARIRQSRQDCAR